VAVALVLVLVVLVAWVVAGRIVRRLASTGGRPDGAALAVGLPPVPEPPQSVAAPAHASPPEPNVVLIRPVAVPRPVRRCGHCRAVGHMRTTCPRLTGALTLPQL
jgi:hypothetical protein